MHLIINIQKKAQKVKALEQEYIKTNDKDKGVELEKASRDLRLYAQDTKEKIQTFKEHEDFLNQF